MYRYYIKNLRFINYSKFCIVLKIKNCTSFYFASLTSFLEKKGIFYKKSLLYPDSNLKESHKT
jgi:hypothetical protein